MESKVCGLHVGDCRDLHYINKTPKCISKTASYIGSSSSCFSKFGETNPRILSIRWLISTSIPLVVELNSELCNTTYEEKECMVIFDIPQTPCFLQFQRWISSIFGSQQILDKEFSIKYIKRSAYLDHIYYLEDVTDKLLPKRIAPNLTIGTKGNEWPPPFKPYTLH